MACGPTSFGWLVHSDFQPEEFLVYEEGFCCIQSPRQRFVSVSVDGTLWRSWLRYCDTTRNVAGSIPDGVTRFFHLHNPSDRTGRRFDSASNRSEYQECFLGGKGGRCIGLRNLPPSCADCHAVWEPQPPGTLRACPGITVHLPFNIIRKKYLL